MVVSCVLRICTNTEKKQDVNRYDSQHYHKIKSTNYVCTNAFYTFAQINTQIQDKPIYIYVLKWQKL